MHDRRQASGYNYQINMGVLSEKTRECLFSWFLYVHQHRHNHWLKWFFYWRTSGRKLIKRFLTLYCAHLENHIITVAPSTQSSQANSYQVCFISLQIMFLLQPIGRKTKELLLSTWPSKTCRNRKPSSVVPQVISISNKSR